MKKTLPKTSQYKSYDDWFNNLPFDKQMYVAQHVKKKIDKIHADTTEIIDSCYIGAMIEILEMDLDDCIKIASKANENMQVTQKILDSKKGNDYYMKVNNEKLRSQIREEAKAMLKSNPKESTLNISRELEKEYELPVKDLHIIVKEALKELKAENKEPIPSQATGKLKAILFDEGEHGFEMINEEYQKKIKKITTEEALKEIEKVLDKSEELTDKEIERQLNTLPYTVTEKEIEEERFIDVKDVVKELGVVEVEFVNPNKPKLKIMSINIEGIYGIYTKSDSGVTTGDKTYKDITELKEYKSCIESDYAKTEQEIKAQIEDLNIELYNLEVDKKQKLEKCAEIESVFQI